MLDRYRPKQHTAREDAVRTARLTVEHQEVAARYLAAERRRKAVAFLLVVLALGGGVYFFLHQHSSGTLSPVSGAAKQTPAGKDLINQTAVREAVYRALQSRGIGAQQGERVILSDGNERRELDLRPPEKRREPSPK